ncbi:hypothetical protein niasHT_016332 [Heterodera trifolii]|uniref:polynucleotide adenylyltransferase n=1 Tax=Heterodera trifolii TaxID=157864 RepID=A0ABD2KZ04_9BILA
MDQSSVDQLELNNPILMAIGIENDGFLKILYEGINKNGFNGNVMFIKLSILFAKIIAHFANCQKKDSINKYKIYWKRFDQIMGKNDEWRNESNKQKTLAQLDELLAKMDGEFGTPKVTERLKVILNDFERYLIKLYEENEAFRNNFHEQPENWEGVKEIFVSAVSSSCDNSLLNKTMKLFEGVIKPQKEDFIKNNANINFVKELKDQIVEFENTKEQDAIIVMKQYMELLTTESVDNLRKDSTFMQSLQMHATLWYYRKCFNSFLEFADTLIEQHEQRNAKFKIRIDKYKLKGQNLSGQNSEKSNGKKRELCMTYKLAYELATDRTLIKINSDWKTEIENFVQKEKEDLSKYTKMTVLPENGETEWANMDCTSERNFLQIKENLVQMVNMQTMFLLENFYPDIFHFEHLLTAQYLSLLTRQMQFQSGTLCAEFFEARIMAPNLIRALEIYEANLANDAPNLSANAKKIYLKKIANAKGQFFEEQQNLKMGKQRQRQNVCKLIEMAKFVEQFLMKNSSKFQGINAKNVTKIVKWKPTECETEKGVKRALAEQRQRMRKTHFEYLDRLLSEKFFRARFNKISGAKERIRKLLTDGTDKDEEANAEKIMALFRTPECVREAFLNAPLSHFYEEALLDEKCQFHQMANWLKADVVVIAQKIELALEQNAKRIKPLGEFWKKNKYSFMELFDRILDSEISEIELRVMEYVKLIHEFMDKVMKKCTEMSLNWEKDKTMGFLCLNSNEKTSDRQKTEQKADADLYGKWINNLHFDTLTKLMAENGQMKSNLKKVYESSEEAIKILMNRFGIERANEILRICGTGAEIKEQSVEEILMEITEKERENGTKKNNKNRRKKENKKKQKEKPTNGRIEKGGAKTETKKNESELNKSDSNEMENKILSDEETQKNYDGQKDKTLVKMKVKEDDEVTTKEDDKITTKDDEKVTTKYEDKVPKVEIKYEGDKVPKVDDQVTTKDEDKVPKVEIKYEGDKVPKVDDQVTTKDEDKVPKVEIKYERDKVPKVDDKVTTKEDDKITTKDDDKVTTKDEDKVSKVEIKYEGDKVPKVDDKVTTKEDEKTTTKEDDKVTTKGDDKITTKDDDKITTKDEDKVSKVEIKYEGDKVPKVDDKVKTKEDDKVTTKHEENKVTTKEEELLSSKGNMKTNLNELKSEGKAKYESEEKEGEENCNGKMPKFDGKVPSRNEHEMANWEPKSEENSEEEDNLDQNELIHLKIGHFSDDNLLSLKYGELFWVLNKESWENDEENNALTVKTLSWTLHFGVYANEISHRIGLFGTLEKLKIIGKNEKLEIEKQWEKLKMVELSKIISRSDRSKLMAKLHLLLKKIVASMDGFWAENGTNLWAEIGETKSQLHSRKLARAMAKSETERQLTRKMDKVILALIQTENNGREDEMPKHRTEFEEQLKAVKHFDGQRKLDQTLFNELTKEANLIELVEEKEREKFRLTKLAQFPERWQEIKYEENSKINEEKTKQILKETQKINHSKETLKNLTDKLEKTIQNWSAEVRIQFSSLMHLQMQLDQIDAIGILPHGFDQRNVLGKFQCDQSDAKRSDQCADESLHCTLCRHPSVTLLQKFDKVKHLEVPQLTFKFSNLKINLQIVTMPNSKSLPYGNYNHEQFSKLKNEIVNEIKEKFVKNSQFEESERKCFEELKSKLKVLADYSFYAKIEGEYLNGNWTDEKQKEKEKEGPKKVDKFRQILAYLELWAKNNQILDDLMGYLNMKMLLTMLTKIFLLYPNGSMPFLVEKFFLTYSTWNWPLPVQLAEINYERDGGFLSWSPFREWFIKRQTTHAHLRTTIVQQLTMPIITPTFPEQNVGANLNGATAKVILNELRIAFQQIRNGQNFNSLLKRKKFSEKYAHFILVICSGHQINLAKFTPFVGKSIRYELHNFLQNSSLLSKRVDFFHVYPKAFPVNGSSSGEHSSRVISQWLVGIELLPGKAVNSELRSELSQMLGNFDAKVKNAFNYFLFHAVDLFSEYVEKNELKLRGFD